MTFTRGDSFLFKFQRKNINNEIILTKSQKMWFTVKEDYETKDILIQKSLDNGIEFANDGYYHIEIRPNDTRNLDYGIYVCDIQIENNGIVKTLYLGKIKLTKEVTFEGGE